MSVLIDNPFSHSFMFLRSYVRLLDEGMWRGRVTRQSVTVTKNEKPPYHTVLGNE